MLKETHAYTITNGTTYTNRERAIQEEYKTTPLVENSLYSLLQ